MLAFSASTSGPDDSDSTDLFQCAFHAAAIGMAMVGLDGRWLKVNGSLARIVGYTEEELLATDFQSITHPDDLTGDLELAQQLIAGRIPSYDMEKRYIHKDGRIVPVMLFVTLVRSADGSPRFFLSQIKDMTAERRFRNESKMFFEASAEMLAITGSSGSLDVVNDAWQRTLGWTAEELTSVPFLDFVHPDDRSRTVDEAKAVAAGRPTLGFRNRYRAKDGSFHWLEWNTQPTMSGRLYCVVRDVTKEHEATLALQASERRFRGLAEGSIQGIVVLQDEVRHRPLYANAVAARMFAFASAEEMTRTSTLVPYLSPEAAQPHSTPFRPSRPPPPRGATSERVQMRRKDGAHVWVDVLRTRVEWNGHQAVQLTLVDVTEQMRLELSLERSARVQRAMARHLPKGAVFLFDHQLRYLLADGSALFEAMGLPRGAMEGRTVHDFVSHDNREMIVDAYRDALSGVERRVELCRKGRTFDILTVPIRDDFGTVIAGMALAYDVTDRKREADELREARALLAMQADSLRELSRIDPLTGVLNRRGFLGAAEERREGARGSSDGHVLLFIDLDGMKPINDELGHDAGDEALREAAAILGAAAGEGDVVARLGGDEFALFAPSARTDELVRMRIEGALAAANARDGRRFRLSMSIGTTTFGSSDPRPLEALLSLADARMYEHKRGSRAARVRHGQSAVAGAARVVMDEMRRPYFQSVANEAHRSERCSGAGVQANAFPSVDLVVDP